MHRLSVIASDCCIDHVCNHVVTGLSIKAMLYRYMNIPLELTDKKLIIGFA